MANRFNDFLKKAHGAIAQLRGGGANCFLGKNGEVIFSKNNVCVHESGGESANGDPVHSPGYLTIQCSEDDHFGITLILQWLPNTLLEKTPSSIRCVSPLRGRIRDEEKGKEEAGGEKEEEEKSGAQVTRFICSNRSRTVDSDEGECAAKCADGEGLVPQCEQMNGRTKIKAEEQCQTQQRPQSLIGLSIPSIRLIPNTPVDQQQQMAQKIRCDQQSESSEPTSGEDGDEEEDKFGDVPGECFSSSEDDEQEEMAKTKSLDALRKSCAATLTRGVIPEQFAREHNLMLANESTEETEEGGGTSGNGTVQQGNAVADGGRAVTPQQRAAQQRRKGKMRSMRVFYSDPERTCGQLVIASRDSQYKIFHFHHTGLDKLTELFERWDAVKAKSAVGNESPHANGQERHLLISPGAETELARAELDPEDGLYERLGWELWRSYVSADGSVEDGFTIRKTIFFSSMEPTLRKELWPFLLRVYPWNATAEQRENIRNEMFVRYQRLKGQRMGKTKSEGAHQNEQQLAGVEQSIVKDVLRTDRRNSFFAGEENPNLDTMKSILLTYAARNPEVGYIQGMSDLLAPLLCTLRDEPLAYWCFVKLIEQTLFRQSNRHEQRSEMEVQLDLMRELLRLFTPGFHAHLAKLGEDAPDLMFVHRWILLFFKREFPARDSLRIWEACWSRYRTNYFHLFVACAIVSIYGPDVVAQNLPHDEILFYFSSLSMHMDANLILRKARGLLYQFRRLPRIPCTLAGICSYESDSEQWASHIEPHAQFECCQKHGENGEEQCPFSVNLFPF